MIPLHSPCSQLKARFILSSSGSAGRRRGDDAVPSAGNQKTAFKRRTNTRFCLYDPFLYLFSSFCFLLLLWYKHDELFGVQNSRARYKLRRCDSWDRVCAIYRGDPPLLSRRETVKRRKTHTPGAVLRLSLLFLFYMSLFLSPSLSFSLSFPSFPTSPFLSQHLLQPLMQIAPPAFIRVSCESLPGRALRPNFLASGLVRNSTCVSSSSRVSSRVRARASS